MKKAVIYDRASTSHQSDNYSREDAYQMGMEIAKKNGFEATFESEVGSGERLSNRPVLMSILDRVNRKEVQAIIVQHPDRLSRDTTGADGGHILRICRESGAKILTQQGAFEPKNDNDLNTLRIMLLGSGLQKQAINRQTRQGQRAKAKVGGFLGGIPPMGYEIAMKQNGRRVETDYEILLEEAEVIRELFHYYIDNGPTATMRHLNEGGLFKTIKGEYWRKKCEKQGHLIDGKYRVWDCTEVDRIVKNPLYCGLVTWGRKRSDRYQGEEPTTVRRKELAIVSIETWQRAKDRRDRARSSKWTRRSSSKHLLSGFIRCKHCGHPLAGGVNTDRRGKKPVRRVMYNCTERRRRGDEGDCPKGQTLSESVAIRVIVPFLAGILEEGLRMDQALDIAGKNHGDNGKADLEESYRASLEKVKAQSERIVEAIATGLISRDEAERQLTKIRKRKARLEREILGLAEKRIASKEVEEALLRLKGRDIEATLWQMIERKPQVFKRLLGLVFKNHSIVVESVRLGYSEYTGEIVDFELAPDLADLLGLKRTRSSDCVYDTTDFPAGIAQIGAIAQVLSFEIAQ